MTLDRTSPDVSDSAQDAEQDRLAAEFADALAPALDVPEPAPARNPTPEPVPAAHRRWLTLAAVAAVVLIGLNLRAGIASAAALFHDLQLLLGYGPLVAALLPTVPVLCFALAGAATAWLSSRMGLERAIA